MLQIENLFIMTSDSNRYIFSATLFLSFFFYSFQTLFLWNTFLSNPFSLQIFFTVTLFHCNSFSLQLFFTATLFSVSLFLCNPFFLQLFFIASHFPCNPLSLQLSFSPFFTAIIFTESPKLKEAKEIVLTYSSWLPGTFINSSAAAWLLHWLFVKFDFCLFLNSFWLFKIFFDVTILWPQLKDFKKSDVNVLLLSSAPCFFTILC